MKHIEFKTSKGTFVIVEYSDIETHLIVGDKTHIFSKKDNSFFTHIDNPISVKDVTEQQASEIVDEELDSHLKPCYKSYTLKEIEHVEWEDEFIHYSAIDSLHSLLKSKGVHLFKNPHPRRYIMGMTDKGIIDTTEKLYLEAEANTFYNPYILKKSS